MDVPCEAAVGCCCRRSPPLPAARCCCCCHGAHTCCPTQGGAAAPMRGRRLAAAVCAELVGTGALLFLGCMAGAAEGEAPSRVGGALVSGMAVAAVIQMVGHVSQAHVNPAVTLGRLLRGGFGVRAAFGYLLAQLAGATLGYRLLMAVTPRCDCRTAPGPAVLPLQALLVEAAGAAGLVLQCHASWDGHLSGLASLQFGFYMTAISLAAGPYTGGSLNPARSLAPALWTGVWTHHWVYWLGPLLGSAVATLLYLLALAPPASSVANPADSRVPGGEKCVVPAVCL